MHVAARVRPAAQSTWQTLVPARVLVTAGSIYLVRTPEHFEEGAQFGRGAIVGALFRLTPWLITASLILLATDAVRLRLRLSEPSDA